MNLQPAPSESLCDCAAAARAARLERVPGVPQPGSSVEDLEATIRALRVQNAQLTETLAEVETFSCLLSHDLRAPLQAITCFAQILQRKEAGNLSEEGRHRLSRIVQGALRMDATISEVLAYARAARQDLRVREIDLGVVARKVVEEVQGAYPRTTVQFGELPTIACDGVLVREVLTNLVANAMKFSEGAKSPTVRIDCVERVGELEVRVHDNGAGFDPAYAYKLFGFFQRLHAQHEFPGTGVGLALVKRVVARLGGSVRAESEPGVCTTFAFTLPRRHQSQITCPSCST